MIEQIKKSHTDYYKYLFKNKTEQEGVILELSPNMYLD